MKASTCAAKVCFTLRRMTVVSEEEPFFCLRTADLLALRTLPFMGAMIPQSPCEHNALDGTDLAITPYSAALAHRSGGLAGVHSYGAEGGVVLCSRLLPFSPVSLVPSSLLILIRVRATAHTPNLAAEGLTVAVHEANAEVHEPRVGAILGTRGRRPITGRLDIAKGMA